MNNILSDNKAMVSDFLNRLDKNIAAIEDSFSVDCQAYLPGSLLPTDRQGFKQFVGMLYQAFPDLHHEIVQQVAEEDRVASVVTARGTHLGDFQGIPATARKVVITDILVLHLRDGKVTRLWAQFDVLGLLQQLGVGAG